MKKVAMAVAICAAMASSSVFSNGSDGFYSEHPDKTGFNVGVASIVESDGISGRTGMGWASDSYEVMAWLRYAKEDDKDVKQSHGDYASAKETLINPQVSIYKVKNINNKWRVAYGVGFDYTHATTDLSSTYSNGDSDKYGMGLPVTIGCHITSSAMIDASVVPLSYSYKKYSDGATENKTSGFTTFILTYRYVI